MEKMQAEARNQQASAIRQANTTTTCSSNSPTTTTLTTKATKHPQSSIDSFKLKGLQCDSLTLIDANTPSRPSEPKPREQKSSSPGRATLVRLKSKTPPTPTTTTTLAEDSRFILKPTNIVEVDEEENNNDNVTYDRNQQKPSSSANTKNPIGLLATLRMETSQLHQRHQDRKQATNGSGQPLASNEQPAKTSVEVSVSKTSSIATTTTGSNFQSIPSYTSIFKPQHPPAATTTTTTNNSDVVSYQRTQHELMSQKQSVAARVPLRKQTNLDSIGRRSSVGFSAKNLRDSARNNRNNQTNLEGNNDSPDDYYDNDDDIGEDDDDDQDNDEQGEDEEEEDDDEDDMICEDDGLILNEQNSNLILFNNNNTNKRQKQNNTNNNNNKRLISMTNQSSKTSHPGTASRQTNNHSKSASVARNDKKTYKSSSPSLNSVQNNKSRASNKISFGEVSRPPSFNTCQAQVGSRDCRKLDLLEQVACLSCSCNNCLKKRKLASLNDNGLVFHSGKVVGGGANFNNQQAFAPPPPTLNLNQFGYSYGKEQQAQAGKTYPKTRIMHLILKSIILLLCTMLLLLLLFGLLMMSLHMPKAFDNMINATRQFNVTISGR